MAMATGLSPLLAGAGAGAGAGAMLQVHAEPPRVLPQVTVLGQPRTNRSGAGGARSFAAAALEPAALVGAAAAVAAAAVLRRARRRGGGGTLRALVAACAVKKGAQKVKPKAGAVARALEALQQIEQGVVPGGTVPAPPGAAAGLQAGRRGTMVAEAEQPAAPVHKDGRSAKRNQYAQAAMGTVAGRVSAAVAQAEREATQKKPADEHKKADPMSAAHEEPPGEHHKANGVHATNHEAEHHDHTVTLEKHVEAPASVAHSLADLVAEAPQAAAPEQEEPPKGRDPIHNALEALDHERVPKAAPEEVPQETAPQAEEAKGPGSALADALAALAGSDLGSFRSAPQEAPRNQVTQQESQTDMMDYFLRVPPRRRVEVEAPAESQEDEEEGEKEEKEDDKDEEESMVKRRRRGDSEISAFVLETGGTTGNVGVGLKNVQVRLGGRQILQDASWYVKTGERLAMVGANGCGKTTQLRVLTGEITPEEGTILLSSPELKMAVLSQGFVDELDPQRTLRDELLAAVPREAAVLKELRELEQEFQAMGQDQDGGAEVSAEKIERLTDLQTLAEQLRVYELDDRFDSIVTKVGFLPEDLDQLVGLFSGGWKVRIGLSKIFMTAPDVLLLDEPTNHLDLESVEWLEKFLCTQTLPIVLVSHDREFMDRVSTKVVETVEGMTYTYQGGYSDYVAKRDERLQQWQKKYELQEKKVKELEDFIKANHGKQMMSNARNRKIEELTKLKESDDYLDPPPRYMRRIQFKFPEPPQARRGSRKETTLARLIDVTHGYGDAGDSVLFEGACMELRAGDKIGIVGRNGAGKSTLLRLLMGAEKPCKGSVMPAEPSTTGYFTQHQADLLPPDQTALEVVQEGNQIMLGHPELLEVMKKFRFRGDRLKVKVQSLSGGEKARLAIVRMMLTPAKLLVFDEPTNHLDIPMKETLEYSMREFEGAVVVVSHDRWFLSQTCTQIMAIENGKLVAYNGDYRYYMENNLELRKKVEMRYTRDSQGIQPVPYSLKEREQRERGGLKKNRGKREAERRKELIATVYGTGRARR